VEIAHIRLKHKLDGRERGEAATAGESAESTSWLNNTMLKMAHARITRQR
jgi:hypothetical protein